MRTLAVCLALTLPAITAASAGSRSTSSHHLKGAVPTVLKRAKATRAKGARPACQVGCHVHRQRVAVRWLHTRVLKRSLQAALPRPRGTRLSWRAGQVRHELAFWKRRDRRTRTLAAIPLSVRVPRWQAWQCIARYESAKEWDMSPDTRPSSGGAYWGGLQMDAGFMQTYGADMIRRHHGGLANTWTAVEQITVANRAWQTRGFEPWPNTSRDCGLR